MERGGDGASECEGEGESERARYSGTGNYPVFFLRSWLAYLVLQLVDKKQRVFNFLGRYTLYLPLPASPNGEERKIIYTLRSFPYLGEGRDGGK